jgi:hypothetical protein
MYRSRLSALAFLTQPVYLGTRAVERDPPSQATAPSPPPSHACRDLRGACWFHMSAGFYGASADVARALAACDPGSLDRAAAGGDVAAAGGAVTGPDDAMTGWRVWVCSPWARAVDLPAGLFHHDHRHEGRLDHHRDVLDQHDVHGRNDYHDVDDHHEAPRYQHSHHDGVAAEIASMILEERIAPAARRAPAAAGAATVSVVVAHGLGNQVLYSRADYILTTHLTHGLGSQASYDLYACCKHI